MTEKDHVKKNLKENKTPNTPHPPPIKKQNKTKHHINQKQENTTKILNYLFYHWRYLFIYDNSVT